MHSGRFFEEKIDPYFSDDFGKEIPDSTPVELPVELIAQPGFLDIVQRHIQMELARAKGLEALELESMEEADDFDIGDDYDPDVPYSPYELSDLPAAPADEGSPLVEEVAPPPASEPVPQSPT